MPNDQVTKTLRFYKMETSLVNFGVFFYLGHTLKLNQMSLEMCNF